MLKLFIILNININQSLSKECKEEQQIIIDAINFHCPFKKVHLRTSHNPWMTTGLINACNKKNNPYKKIIKNRNEINEQRYKKYKNKLISVLRMSKQEYYTKILNKHKKNINETWNILRNVTGSSTANTFQNSFVINNKLISNKNDIVNDFNNFITNIGPDLAKNISNTSIRHFTDYLGTSVTESISLFPVSYSELLNVVSKQKCKKSFDYRSFNMWIIKK